ncbi:MAG: FHA domain-containing protein [Proteobacteria bacterium]|nr:FHA domain-containing protein [Pseudomonadota bacterium]
MPIIILSSKDKKILEYKLADGKSCAIGRKNSNDIVIASLAVSGSHAKIESVAKAFVLTDLDSTNGTFVNGTKITLHNLRHKDVITIGKHQLVFDRSDLLKKKADDPDDYEDDKTRIIDVNEYRDVLQSGKGASSKTTQPNPSAALKPQKTSFFTRLLEKFFG